jgi:cytochrome c oxidase subunit 2
MEWHGRLTRWGTILGLVLISALMLGACDIKTPNTLDPKGPVALWQSNLFWFILVVATIIFVGVTGVLLYSIIRFRDRPGAAEARQFDGNSRLEIAWTILPSLVLFLVLIFTIYTLYNMTPSATAANTLHVRAIGHQWWWEFQYEDASPVVVTGDELHVPVGTVVHVDLASDNVIHSFWIPQLSGKTDVIPGHDNSLVFKADAAGNYRGECGEYCGTQHANMNFVVVADTPDVYASWLQSQQALAAVPSTDQQQSGLSLFQHAGCAGCHSINGVNAQPGKPGPTIGPNLTHFGSRQLIAGGVLSNTNDNLTKWLADPQGIKPGNDMVIPVQLDQSQISDLVAYLESLK